MTVGPSLTLFPAAISGNRRWLRRYLSLGECCCCLVQVCCVMVLSEVVVVGYELLALLETTLMVVPPVEDLRVWVEGLVSLLTLGLAGVEL